MPAALTAEQRADDHEVLLDAVESLVYAKGVQAVGMDEIREASGLSLKRIYAEFATKEELVVAMLSRRDRRWRASLAGHVDGIEEPSRRIAAMFAWLGAWFAEDEFRGCAWINIHGELGAGSPAIRDEVRSHKDAFRRQIAGWLDDAANVDAIYLLAEGAIVAAGITGDPGTAAAAHRAAERLLSE